MTFACLQAKYFCGSWTPIRTFSPSLQPTGLGRWLLIFQLFLAGINFKNMCTNVVILIIFINIICTISRHGIHVTLGW